MVEVWTH